jgi:hypothetical protein
MEPPCLCGVSIVECLLVAKGKFVPIIGKVGYGKMAPNIFAT